MSQKKIFFFQTKNVQIDASIGGLIYGGKKLERLP